MTVYSDVFPQNPEQLEDQLTEESVTNGFTAPMLMKVILDIIIE
jgi:hypothetical protein